MYDKLPRGRATSPAGHPTVQGSDRAIQYAFYRPDDAICCPTGGDTLVRFEPN
jgi:hypothetical protein